MKLAIVGTHSIEETQENYALMRAAVFRTVNFEKIDQIVSGGALGIDTMAEMLAAEFDFPMKVYRAEWNKYGRSAGPRRNTFIVNHCDRLVAFPDIHSVGTRDSMKKAKAQKKLVGVWDWETIEKELNAGHRFTD